MDRNNQTHRARTPIGPIDIQTANSEFQPIESYQGQNNRSPLDLSKKNTTVDDWRPWDTLEGTPFPDLCLSWGSMGEGLCGAELSGGCVARSSTVFLAPQSAHLVHQNGGAGAAVAPLRPAGPQLPGADGAGLQKGPREVLEGLAARFQDFSW